MIYLVGVVSFVVAFTIAWGLRGKRISELKDEVEATEKRKAAIINMEIDSRRKYERLEKIAYIRDGRRFVKY